jgi:hypothetical protein
MTDTTHPHPLDAAIEAMKPFAWMYEVESVSAKGACWERKYCGADPSYLQAHYAVRNITPLYLAPPDASALAEENRRLRARVEALEENERLLDLVADEYLEVASFEMPMPGGDDSDVGWRVRQPTIARPGHRVLTQHYKDDLRTALREAEQFLTKEPTDV